MTQTNLFEFIAAIPRTSKTTGISDSIEPRVSLEDPCLCREMRPRIVVDAVDTEQLARHSSRTGRNPPPRHDGSALRDHKGHLSRRQTAVFIPRGQHR